MSIDVKEIRKKYPNPISLFNKRPVESGRTDFYCVGGAFCLFKGIPSRFPNFAVLHDSLMDENSQLTSVKASFYSLMITQENDRESFERAWEYLDQALTWKPEYPEKRR